MIEPVVVGLLGITHPHHPREYERFEKSRAFR